MLHFFYFYWQGCHFPALQGTAGVFEAFSLKRAAGGK
jgi:hypothetical protein